MNQLTTKDNRTARICATVAVLAAVPIIMLASGFSAEAGFLRFLVVGHRFEARALPELRESRPPVYSEHGYDGQFYAQLALDPTLRRPASSDTHWTTRPIAHTASGCHSWPTVSAWANQRSYCKSTRFSTSPSGRRCWRRSCVTWAWSGPGISCSQPRCSGTRARSSLCLERCRTSPPWLWA